MQSEVNGSSRSRAVPWQHIRRLIAVFLGYSAFAAVLAMPVAAEQAVEHLSFQDRIGTVPVEVSLAHNGLSTVDTGVLGQLYWDQTGGLGFGAYVRLTGTPQAEGTLASYTSPVFVRANASFISDPAAVAAAYGDELQSRFWVRFLVSEGVAALLGGLVLTAVARGRSPRLPGDRLMTKIATAAAVVAALAGVSIASATWLFSRWDGTVNVDQRYSMPGVPELSFSSPQTLEVARQIEPFLTKNNDRIRARSEAYQVTVAASLDDELALKADDLVPDDGELLILAEADPQGSVVGTAVRRAMYPSLLEALGEDSFALRSISGDITSNGTVAEAGFVEQEASASGTIPVVAVKGDHDTSDTVEQLDDEDVANPDLDVEDIGGLNVAVANDPAFKTLFGGISVNESGITEYDLGAKLRDEVGEDSGALVVLLHQPTSAAGYIGVESLSVLDDSFGFETTPRDDGIPDLPPGIINVGHLHDPEPPKVIWNTDTDQVTWTVLNQLGTSGGVEESPTFNRFSTPFSVPLKTLSVQIQYIDSDTGMQTGYAPLDVAVDGIVTIGQRINLGLPD